MALCGRKLLVTDTGGDRIVVLAAISLELLTSRRVGHFTPILHRGWVRYRMPGVVKQHPVAGIGYGLSARIGAAAVP